VFGSGKFDEGVNVFCASAAAAGVFQTEPGFDLAWHNATGTSCIADIRIGDSLAQAQIHERLPVQERL
jgi:hypothetical protein